MNHLCVICNQIWDCECGKECGYPYEKENPFHYHKNRIPKYEVVRV